MKKTLTPILMFFTGGFLYLLAELAWRRYTHWSMFFAGGTCFLIIDAINKKLHKTTPLWVRCTLGAAVITGVEFLSGCIVNLWANWQVWDYSRFKMNFMGQICMLYTVLWFFLTAPVIWLANQLHHRFDALIDRFSSH